MASALATTCRTRWSCLPCHAVSRQPHTSVADVQRVAKPSLPASIPGIALPRQHGPLRSARSAASSPTLSPSTAMLWPGTEAEAMLGPAWSWRFVRTTCSKWSARLRGKMALSTRGLHFSRFRGKRNKGRPMAGSHHSGRLSHGYRCDNVTLIGRPVPHARRSRVWQMCAA